MRHAPNFPNTTRIFARKKLPTLQSTTISGRLRILFNKYFAPDKKTNYFSMKFKKKARPLYTVLRLGEFFLSFWPLIVNLNILLFIMWIMTILFLPCVDFLTLFSLIFHSNGTKTECDESANGNKQWFLFIKPTYFKNFKIILQIRYWKWSCAAIASCQLDFSDYNLEIIMN